MELRVGAERGACVVSTIGVTGATGHLGRVLVPYLWEHGKIVVEIGREIPPDLDVDAVIHLAAPQWDDDDAVRDFAPFNEALARWSETTGGRVVNVGSWWQYAGGGTAALAYSRLKADQMATFPVTVVPFSIYATSVRAGRGFVPQLLAAARGLGTVRAASVERRDWIHATDVCAALRAALVAPDGIYEASTGVHYSPAELCRTFLDTEPDVYPDNPSCSPRHMHSNVPAWAPRIDVLGYLRRSLGQAA
jgi:nucleoside-diphosphate-sugar epimerase